jgi:hypothetical protein
MKKRGRRTVESKIILTGKMSRNEREKPDAGGKAKGYS